MQNAEQKSSNPAVHSQYIQDRLTGLMDHLRADVHQVSEPRFQALLETSAEVLSGLRTAYIHYDQQTEKAWRR
ncbi:MAG TPA: hypothetical protein VK737_06440 [Opitutales bacterium]|jgi:hypothetical protein|nr:hypothetical protein [Opitutales bacterium]